MARQTFSAFARELDKISPKLAQAFLEAVQDVRSVSQRRAIEAAIERQDIEGVIQAIRLGREFFAPLDRQIEDAFRQGAIWQMEQLPKKAGPEGAQLVIRFDQRNPRAERWVRETAGGLITDVLEDQRTMIREVVSEGMEAGRGPAAIARDLIGVRVGNQRKGGLIGLHSKDAAAVRRAREELADPAQLRAYMRRSPGFNKYPPGGRTVLSAIKNGRALTAEEQDKIARQYADKLLRDRGERIARTEAHHAFSAGRNEANMQMVDSGQIPSSAVKLVWQATPGRRTRDAHALMHGQTVSMGTPFTSPLSGAQFMFPGDTSLGAPAEEIINCRCGVRTEIDFVSLAR